MSQGADCSGGGGVSSTLIVMPVFGNLALAGRAVRSLDQRTPESVPLLVVDDAGGEPVTEAWLRELISSGRSWTLRRNLRNLGFVETSNDALSGREGRDVLLVNSDVEVFDGWFEAMTRAAAESGDVASVTAVTNAGSIATSSMAARMATPKDMARLAAEHRPVQPTCELPVAVGHCVLLTDRALRDVGLFDLAFSPGYGEEVDWSIRARRRGWRHVAALGAMVWHEGAGSFPRRGLKWRRRRAEVRILRRYPREFFALRRARVLLP